MPNELHTMPLKLERLFSSRNVRSLKIDEFGAYIWLLCEGWLEGAKLPTDLEEIKRFVPHDSEEQWERIKKFVISRFFHPSEDGRHLVNDTSVETYSEVIEKLESKHARGLAGAEARWGLKDAEQKEKQCKSNAKAMLKHPASNANQNQGKETSPDGDAKKDAGALSLTDSLKIPEKLGNDAKFAEAWETWVKFRKAKGKVKDWRTLFQKQLDWLGEGDAATAVKILDKSMRNGWTGLFPLKPEDLQSASTGLGTTQKGAKSYEWSA